MPRDTIPHIRYEGMNAVVDGRAFLFGGFHNEALDAFTQVDVVDLRTGEWTRTAAMPHPATHVQAAVVGDSAVWLAGGFVGGHPAPPTAATYRYDILADRWSAGPALPAARGGGALVARGDTLHYAGGWAEDRATDHAEHWILLPGARAWVARAPLPSPRGHASAAVVHGALYVVGGQQNHDPLPVDLVVAHRYDASADRWLPVAPLPVTRSHAEPGTVVWRDWIFLFGGSDIGAGVVNAPDWLGYDTARNQWRMLPTLPRPLRAPSAWVYLDTVHITAGAEAGHRPSNLQRWVLPLVGAWHPLPGAVPELQDGQSAVLGDWLYLMADDRPEMWRYHLGTGRWDQAGQLARRPAPAPGQRLAAFDGALWVAGHPGGRARGSVQRFDPVAGSWSLGPSLPIGLVDGTLVATDSVLWYLGGRIGRRVTDEVWRLQRGASRWEPAAAMPQVRAAAVATWANGVLIVGGGRAEADLAAFPTDDIHWLDVRAGRWRSGVPGCGGELHLPTARANGSHLVATRRGLRVVGNAAGEPPVEELDLASCQWHAPPAAELVNERIGAVAVDGDRTLALTHRALRMLWDARR